MKRILWETHMHTAESSRCGHAAAADMVRAYHAAGFHGLIITDHFVNANSPGNIDAPWQTRIDLLLRGYRAAAQAGRALGMPVLLGWEYSFKGGDYLTYGVGEAFLRDHPGMDLWDIDTYARRIHAAGGFLSQAHPYREAWYLPARIAKRWDLVDAIEVVNGSHAPEDRAWDDRALALATRHDLLRTAGSDAHRLDDAATAALAFDEAFTSEPDFLAALRAGRGHVTRIARSEDTSK